MVTELRGFTRSSLQPRPPIDTSSHCYRRWLSIVAVAFAIAILPTASMADTNDDEAAANPFAEIEKVQSQPPSSEQQVLKLQAEKQDSIDRLEKNASEIAKKWRAKQARLLLLNKQARAAAKARENAQKTTDNTPPTNQGTGNQTAEIPTPGGEGTSTSQQDATSSQSAGNGGTTQNPATNGQPATSTDANDEPASNGPAGDSSRDATSAADASNANTDSNRPATVPTIVNGPIDRLALATSLFATNELRECLKILEAVELRQLSLEDKQWHDYLEASCYRKLGNRSEAESLYRSVLQRSNSTWVAKAARWWLQHIDDQAQLKLKHEQVQQTLVNWRKEIDSLKSAH